jgi:hypothetical protein
MNRIHSPLEEVNWIGKLADLKEEHYRNTLLLTAMMELLIDKGLVTRGEVAKKMAELDRIMIPDPTHPIS